MKHLTEEQLIGYCVRETAQKEVIAAHVKECQECRAELTRIEAVLRALDSMEVPDPGANYGARVWQQLEPQLPAMAGRRWNLFPREFAFLRWFEPRRLAAAGALIVIVLAAFLAGRFTNKPSPTAPPPNEAMVRQRVLWLAVGEHLGRSEMMLVELANAEPSNPQVREINFSSEQKRAEDLLEENRLYRQTALQQGDRALASVLDELERVLLDVAHSPNEITPTQLAALQQRIDVRGILFKVRVTGKELQRKQNAMESAPAQTGRDAGERNKA
jgi:hypothetical protein